MSPPAQKSPRVLVHQLGSLGDTLVSLPSLRAIRRHFGPAARITLLHESRAGIPVAPGSLLAPGEEVNDFLAYPVGARGPKKILQIVRLWGDLRKRKFSVVVSLAPAERTADQVRRDRRFFRSAGMAQGLGFHAFDPRELYPRDPDGGPGRTDHEARFRLRRLQRDGVDISCEEDLRRPFYFPPLNAKRAAAGWLRERGWKEGQPLAVLCPGAKQPTNLWPLDRFAEIGRRIRQTGTTEVVVAGGGAERETGDHLVRAMGGGWNAAGRLDVPGSAALLQTSSFLVGLDTGTTHLAAAMGIPCVALYGGRDHPGRWEPLGEGHEVIRSNAPCSPCRIIHAPCPVSGHPCMTQISVEEVWNRVQKIQRRVAVPSR